MFDERSQRTAKREATKYLSDGGFDPFVLHQLRNHRPGPRNRTTKQQQHKDHKQNPENGDEKRGAKS